MSGQASLLADLLAACEAQNVLLIPTGDGELTIESPPYALTPELLGRLKAHKAELLALLRPKSEAAVAVPVPTRTAEAEPEVAVCRCGSTSWQDVPIHDGQSVRRDCGRCGRFIGFPVWYGRETGGNGQQPVG